MGEKKKILQLDKYEFGVIFHSLTEKRNQLLKDNVPTDDVDSVLLKVIALLEEPAGRKGHSYREAR